MRNFIIPCAYKKCVVHNLYVTSPSTVVLVTNISVNVFVPGIYSSTTIIMDTLPLELVERLFEYMPLLEVVIHSELNKTCHAAATRQLSLRCKNISLSVFEPLRERTIQSIFSIIGPHIRHINVDLNLYKLYIPWLAPAIASCTHLESLQYNHRVYNLFGLHKLLSLKALAFVNMDCNESTIKCFISNRCTTALRSLTIDHTNFTGTCLMAAPTTLRQLQFTDSRLEMKSLVQYLRINPNLEILSIYVNEKTTTDLSELANNLRKLKSLDLNCGKSIIKGFEKMATLPDLVRLNVHLKSSDFYKYPAAIDDKNRQQLQELNISIHMFTVTQQFADSLENFKHLKKLSICIGFIVDDLNLLLPSINHLGQLGTLKTVILAGFTNILHLDDNRSQLDSIEDLRVCPPSGCTCNDHFIMIKKQ